MNPFYIVVLLAALMIWFGVLVWLDRKRYQFGIGAQPTLPASAAATLPDQSGNSSFNSFIKRISFARWYNTSS
jgi:hypothetical protein